MNNKLLFFALLGISVFFCQPRQTSKPASESNSFAFWYDKWEPQLTLKKIRPATVIVGVPPSAVPEIHASGRKALQYVTYYQSTFHHPFLKDIDDLPNVGFQIGGQFQKSAFGGEDNYVLCPNSVELKARVLQFLDISLQHGFDGYFVDNTFLDPAASKVCTAKHPHLKTGATGWQAYIELLAAVRQKLKQKNPGYILITNPGNPASADRNASHGSSLWDVSDFVLWESYGYTSHRGPLHDRWKNTIDESFDYAETQKSAKLLVLSYPENLKEALFSFAIAKMFGFNWTANLGDSLQYSTTEGGEFGAFLNDTSFDLGVPSTGLPVKGTALLHRIFENGEVFANTGTAPQSVLASGGGTLYGEGPPKQTLSKHRITVGPMAAVIILHRSLR